IEQGSALLIALRLHCLDPLLTGKLFFECQGSGRCAADLLDLAIQILDFSLEPKLQVIGPPIELFRLNLEELCVSLRNASLDFCLPTLPNRVKRTGDRDRRWGFYLPGKSEETPCGVFIQRLAAIQSGRPNQMIFRLI